MSPAGKHEIADTGVYRASIRGSSSLRAPCICRRRTTYLTPEITLRHTHEMRRQRLSAGRCWSGRPPCQISFQQIKTRLMIPPRVGPRNYKNMQGNLWSKHHLYAVGQHGVTGEYVGNRWTFIAVVSLKTKVFQFVQSIELQLLYCEEMIINL